MNAIRPLGVVLVVAFFFVFSVASAVLLMLEGDQWWVAHVATTGLLTYLFRNLWWGEDKERKIAVFVGFFVVALTIFGSPEEAIAKWSKIDLVSTAEGGYFLLSACYLIYARKNPFFAAGN